MKAFKDNAGRTWTIAINVTAIKRVKALLGVDLLTVVDDKCQLLMQLFDDPILLVDVLFCVCKPDAERIGVSDEQFGEAMHGDALEHGVVALTEDLADFFPTAQKRAALKTLLAKITMAGGRLVELSQVKIEAMDSDKIAQEIFDAITTKTTTLAAKPDPQLTAPELSSPAPPSND